MRSVSQALNLTTSALGAWIIIPLLYIVNSNPSKPWVPTDLDTGYLDYYFILLACLMGLNLLLFWWVSQGYEYKNDAELQECEMLFDESVDPVDGVGGVQSVLHMRLSDDDAQPGIDSPFLSDRKSISKYVRHSGSDDPGGSDADHMQKIRWVINGKPLIPPLFFIWCICIRRFVNAYVQ